MFYASILIAITGLIAYQLFMKTAPHTINPFWLLTVVYVVAALVCVPAAVVWKRFGVSSDTGIQIGTIGPAALIGLSVVFIEAGYLLVYRSGWPISVAPGVVQAGALSTLFVLGFWLFGEKLSVEKSIGLVLALASALLLSRK